MRTIDRITWRDGQLLASRDMRDDERNCEELRRLHIRYLHKTWGVVEGLNVLASGAAMRVTPGYALDIDGRELLHPLATIVEAPASVVVTTTMYLVISRAAGCGGTAVDLATLCPGVRNAIPLEAGSLSWKTVKEVRPGRDVLLARVLVSQGAFTGAPDTSIQRRAASMAQARTYSDATQAGQTGWGLPDQLSGEHAKSPFLVLQATVDTSDAGFVETPTYFARATGSLPAAAGYITASAPTSFTFALRLPGAYVFDVTAASLESTGVTIRWLAVELPPSPRFAPIQVLKGNLT
jgi:hypothetical protein